MDSASNTADSSKIKIGNRVKILFPDNSEKLLIVGTTREVTPQNGVISDECPLGKALLGAKNGDEISYKVGENSFTVKVLAVS